ncbi:MAG: hypothetical protein MI974_01180 [Chitinophagales bacterium]|nr:hypothetical protein [Chitinophagales bacterium]
MKQYFKCFFEVVSIVLVMNNIVFCQQDDCQRSAKFGDVLICLPIIEGYEECYLNAKVKQIADATEISTNSVIGFYLDTIIYDNKDSIGLIEFDNYFKVYGSNQSKYHKANKESLLGIHELLTNNFIVKNWEEVGNEIDKLGLDVEVGLPVIIDSYGLNENSYTYVMLVKYELEGGESFMMAMTVNILLIKERLIWMAYYLDYEGELTIRRLIKQSDKILNGLFANNN